MKSFSGAKIQDIEHYVTPHLEHDKLDIAITHIGSNNVSCDSLDIDVSILAENIIKIGNKCIGLWFRRSGNIFHFYKRKYLISSLIRKVNNKVRVLCAIRKFHLFHMISSLESIYVGMVCI